MSGNLQLWTVIVELPYFEKYIVNQKILNNKMCLEFNFTYAVQISLRSVNSLSYYIYIFI